MKVLMVNIVCGIRSTGRICTDLAVALEKRGHEVKIAYGRETVPEQYEKYAVRIGSNLDVNLHGLRARFFDAAGFGSKKATEKFVSWIKEYNPDIIHLHNIHGYYINVEVLFEYLRECGKKIIWTLHDCWSFTGHCVYFDYVGCTKWKNGCSQCEQRREYPVSLFFDNSKFNYNRKKYIFTEINNLTIVVPSKWLSSLVKHSFLAEYPVHVIYNGVNVDIFKFTDSELRKKYHLEDKKVILGAASIWDWRKGLNFFTELAERLDKNYQIILVGLTEEQIRKLPANVIGITQTNNAQEMAALYTLADVFVNPTLEDNYPSTNIEAIACGTPVITFDTGGSGESAGLFGIVTENKSVDDLLNAIYNMWKMVKGNIDVSKERMVEQYIMLYEREV